MTFVLLEPFTRGTKTAHRFKDLGAAEDQVAQLGARCVVLRSSTDHERDGTLSKAEFIRVFLRGSVDRRRMPGDLIAVSPEGFVWPHRSNAIGSDHLKVFAEACLLLDVSGLDHLVEKWQQGVVVLGDPELHGGFVEGFGIYVPTPAAETYHERKVLLNDKFAAAAAVAKALAALAEPHRTSPRLQAATSSTVRAVGALAESAPASAPVPSLYDGVGVGRRSAAHMVSLADVTFTEENIKTAEMQKLLTQKLEKFLLVDLPADRTTKFPLSESKIDKNRDEKRAVALFLGAGHRGSKKVKAEDMLRAVCKLRGVQSEYFNEQAAASTQ